MQLNISLEVQEVQFVLSAIAKQPFEQVADLWFKLKNQAEAQLKEQSEPPIPASTEAEQA